MSLPAWGAWIEIYKCHRKGIDRLGRSPHGGRGLKLRNRGNKRVGGRSLPAWGAWIEISESGSKGGRWDVAPRMGGVD